MDGLLERDAVLAQLKVLMGRVRRGTGQLVLLRGEAGVGKTAVLTQFVDDLDSSVRLLRGWCDPLSVPRPLGPLIDALAGLDTAAAQALSAALDAGDTAALYRLLLQVLRGGSRWLWVIEDLHWADGATLDLARFLARRIASLPLLLMVSYRDDELAMHHPLAMTLGDVATYAAVSRIGVEPLSAQALAMLAAGTGVNAEQLHQLTGGNPFFVTEILAAGPDALSRNLLPRSVSEAVWGRLARLSTRARRTAEAVAVCGPRAAIELVENICPDVRAGLGECLAAGVLVGHADAVAFRHELARRATLDRIPDHQRRLLHKRALAALAKPPIAPESLAALTFHADEAEDINAVVKYGPAAAKRACALGANREAANLYALVLRRAECIPAAQKVTWLEEHAFSSYVSGMTATSAEWMREAIALRHTLGDRLAEADNLRWLSQMLYPMGRNAEAVQAGHAALRLAENLGPTPVLAWSLINLAELAAFGYDPACAGYAARALALGVELDDPAVVVRARCSPALATVAYGDTGWDQLEAVWREAMADKTIAAHAGVAGLMLSWLAALHHHPRAEAYCSEASAFCSTHDLGAFYTLVTGSGALIALNRGEWALATARAHDVLTRPALSPSHRLMPLVSTALVRARRGQRGVAELLDEALAATEPDDLFRLGPVWAARAEVAWLAGDDDTARAEAAAGLAAATAHADPWLVGHLHRWTHLGGGAPAACTGADPVTPYYSEICGDWRAAAKAWIDRSSPYDAAIAHLGGDITAVESALATFRRLGARAAAERAQHRLVELRGRTPRSRRADTAADPHGLTRRQREIVEQLAAGHSDTEIAALLHISKKTVGHHVEAILAKLGVANRAQAATRAARPDQGGVDRPA